MAKIIGNTLVTPISENVLREAGIGLVPQNIELSSENVEWIVDSGYGSFNTNTIFGFDDTVKIKVSGKKLYAKGSWETYAQSPISWSEMLVHYYNGESKKIELTPSDENQFLGKFSFDEENVDYLTVQCSSLTITFDIFEKMVDGYVNGLMSAEDKENLEGLLGVNNKVGTKAFHIIGYSGTNGGTGAYTIDGSQEDYDSINALINAGEVLKLTVQNGTWFDGYFTVSATEKIEKGINLTVDNFYSNIGNTGEFVEYDATYTYVTSGTDKQYPQLGYNIQQGKAVLFICGHPGFGSFDFNTEGASFGEENISQGEDSFNSGYGNHALGKYSSNFGNGNKAGYDTHTHGRDIDAAMAKDSILAGYGHKITDLVNSVAVFGWMNRCGYPYQTIFGLWNNNKADNLLEVGGGFGGSVKNAFEVDKYGLISANEKYMHNQIIYKNTFTLLEQPKNLLGKAVDGVIKGVTVEGTTTKLGQVFNKPSSTQWVGYVMVNKNILGLEVGATYYLTLKYIINQTDDTYANLTFAPIYSQNAWGATQADNGISVRYESREYIITVPFTVTEENLRYGVFITGAGGKEFDITVDTDVRLYKAYDFDATLPVNTPKSDLMSNGVAISTDNNMFCNYVLPDYMINIRDNNSKIRIVPTNDISATSLNVEIISGKPVDDITIKHLKFIVAEDTKDTKEDLKSLETEFEEIKEDISKIDCNITIDEDGKATINADELYLGDRDVLREAGIGLVPQKQAITDLRPYISSFEQYTEEFGGYYTNENDTLFVEIYHGTLTLDISGKIEFEAEILYDSDEPPALLRIIYQDGKEPTLLTATEGKFIGEYENVKSIQLIDNSEFISAIRFTTLKGDVMVEGYINGLMSAEDKQRLDNLDPQGGGIDIENGRATINAEELYLGNRDVLREAGIGLIPQQQTITNLTECASFEKFSTEDGTDGWCSCNTNSAYAQFWQGVLTLNISGTVEFQAQSQSPNNLIFKIIYQNATEEILSPINNTYSGAFENVKSIELINNFEFMTDIEFTTLKGDVMVEGYVNGLMSVEDKQSLETLKEQTGDMSEALDRIIEIHNLLMGGDS